MPNLSTLSIPHAAWRLECIWTNTDRNGSSLTQWKDWCRGAAIIRFIKTKGYSSAAVF